MPEQLEASAESIRKTTGLLASLGEKLWNYLPTLLIAVIVFLLGILFAKLLARITGRLISRTSRRPKIDKTASGFGISLTRILFYVILTVIQTERESHHQSAYRRRVGSGGRSARAICRDGQQGRTD